MPPLQYVHSVFDSPTLFRPELLLGKYVAMLSRLTTGKNPRATLTTMLAVCSVLLSNKVTSRCNPEFVRLLSGKFTSTVLNIP